MSSNGATRRFLAMLLGACSFWSVPAAQENIKTYSLVLEETAGSPVCLEVSIACDSIPANALYVKLHLSAVVAGMAVGDGAVLTCEVLCRQGADSLLYSISDYFERESEEEALGIGFDLSGLLAALPGGCGGDRLVLHLESGSASLRTANAEGGPYANLQVVSSR